MSATTDMAAGKLRRNLATSRLESLRIAWMSLGVPAWTKGQ
jgi:hypothetical protein